MRAFRYGDGVFVTLAVDGGLVLDATLQLARICAAAEAVGLARPTGFETREEALRSIGRLVSDLCPPDGRSVLRLQWHAAGDSRGFRRLSDETEVLAEGLPVPEPRRPSVATLADAAVPLPAVPRHKTCSAIANVLCAREAVRLGVDEAIRVSRGVVLEASSANVFWLVGRELYTPSAALPLYAGSVRQRVIECAPDVGLSVREGEFAPAAMEAADALLLVNAARGVESARSLDGRELAGAPVVVRKLSLAVETRRREPRVGA